jgi:hypothetical protein
MVTIIVAVLSSVAFIGVFSILQHHRKRRENNDRIRRELVLLKFEIVTKVANILQKEDFERPYCEIVDDEISDVIFLDWSDGLRSVEGKYYSVVRPLWDLLCWVQIRTKPELQVPAKRVEAACNPEENTTALIERLRSNRQLGASEVIWLFREVNKTTLSFYPEIASKMTEYRELEFELQP